MSIKRKDYPSRKAFMKDYNKTEKSKQSKLNYERSKEGLVARIYGCQKSPSKRRGHPAPTYSKEELKDWLFSRPQFRILYDNWKRLDFQTSYKPSVDRIYDDLSYTMSNIQLMIFRDNIAKGNKKCLSKI